MLQKLMSSALMILTLSFGISQIIVTPYARAATGCYDCCPPSSGNRWLVGCQGPFSTPNGDLVGCIYADSLEVYPSELHFCGQTPQ